VPKKEKLYQLGPGADEQEDAVFASQLRSGLKGGPVADFEGIRNQIRRRCRFFRHPAPENKFR
jgi:hypothetical protein